MKKILLLAGAACVLSANAFAIDLNPYVSAKAKYAFARNTIKVTGVNEGKAKFNDNVWGGSIAIGNTNPLIDGALRFELEYTKNADAEKRNVKVKTQAVLLNFYYDIDLKNNMPLTPYIGAGFGWGQSEFKFKHGHTKEDGVSMQIGAGVNYKICNNTSIDFGYRYMTYGDFDKEYRVPGVTYEKFDYKPRAHELLLGVKYDF